MASSALPNARGYGTIRSTLLNPERSEDGEDRARVARYFVEGLVDRGLHWLVRYGDRLARGSGEDLVHETIELVLEGKRKFKESVPPDVSQFRWMMKSIAHGDWKKRTREEPEGRLEPGFFEKTHASEREVEKLEARTAVETLHTRLSNFPEAPRVLDMMAKGSGRREIMN